MQSKIESINEYTDHKSVNVVEKSQNPIAVAQNPNLIKPGGGTGQPQATRRA